MKSSNCRAQLFRVAAEQAEQYSEPMSKTLISITAIFLVTVALAFTLVPQSATEQDFFPLAKNNRWKHLVVFSGGDYIYYMT